MTPHLRRSLLVGAVAALALFAFYATILTLVSGREYTRTQVAKDFPFLAFLLPGFGAQFGLFAHVRGLVHGAAKRVGAAAGASGTMSGASMVACCAHYIPTLLPFLGATAASTLIMAWRTPLLVLAILSNVVGLAVSLRALRKVRGMQAAHAPSGGA